jgi:hypothetical protein
MIDETPNASGRAVCTGVDDFCYHAHDAHRVAVQHAYRVVMHLLTLQSPDGHLMMVRDGATEWNYYAATGFATLRVP